MTDFGCIRRHKHELKWLRGNAFGEVTQGKWPAAKGLVRRIIFGSAAEYMFCSSAAEYINRAAS